MQIYVAYCARHNILPRIFAKYFSECRIAHNHNTRHAVNTNYFLERKHKTMGQRTLQYRGVKFWNELPQPVKSARHLQAFVKSLKHHLINNYHSQFL